MPEAPGDENEENRCPRRERDEQEAAQPRAEQRRESQSRAREADEAPDGRLHPELVPVRGRGLELARERVPRLREQTDQRSADAGGDEVRHSPTGAQHDGLREVDRRAVGGDSDRRLNRQEHECDPGDRRVVSAPDLPDDHERGHDRREDDAGREAEQVPGAVEDEDRQHALGRERRNAAAREVAPRRLGHLYAARRRRRSCCSHHSIPHSQ